MAAHELMQISIGHTTKHRIIKLLELQTDRTYFKEQLYSKNV